MGLPARPPLFESHPLLNSQLLHHLQHGDLTVVPEIDHFDGPDVVLSTAVASRSTWFLRDRVSNDDPLRRRELLHGTVTVPPSTWTAFNRTTRTCLTPATSRPTQGLHAVRQHLEPGGAVRRRTGSRPRPGCSIRRPHREGQPRPERRPALVESDRHKGYIDRRRSGRTLRGS